MTNFYQANFPTFILLEKKKKRGCSVFGLLQGHTGEQRQWWVLLLVAYDEFDRDNRFSLRIYNQWNLDSIF